MGGIIFANDVLLSGDNNITYKFNRRANEVIIKKGVYVYIGVYTRVYLI